jgi:hypothetical protein
MQTHDERHYLPAQLLLATSAVMPAYARYAHRCRCYRIDLLLRHDIIRQSKTGAIHKQPVHQSIHLCLGATQSTNAASGGASAAQLAVVLLFRLRDRS